MDVPKIQKLEGTYVYINEPQSNNDNEIVHIQNCDWEKAGLEQFFNTLIDCAT